MFNTEDSPFFHLEKSDFSLSIWLEKWYPLICEYLHIDEKGDFNSLQRILQKHTSTISKEVIEKKIKGRNILAIAPGIYLEHELDLYLKSDKTKVDFTISSDGATSYLISQNVIPDLIVTDLDGRIEDQIEAQKRGAIVLVHVHEDNIETVEENIAAFNEGEFVFTTQGTPLQGSNNFLGFTDGDRAICLATYLEAHSIHLIGYDFGESIGKYSKTSKMNQTQLERKMKKFTIAKSIINWCLNKNNSISNYIV
ncbi:MAG: 6-hydroxymethylpterin diphosphokinase MptE-like protein [Candidatus Heimdallarchaeaceae archaeon]